MAMATTWGMPHFMTNPFHQADDVSPSGLGWPLTCRPARIFMGASGSQRPYDEPGGNPWPRVYPWGTLFSDPSKGVRSITTTDSSAHLNAWACTGWAWRGWRTSSEAGCQTSTARPLRVHSVMALLEQGQSYQSPTLPKNLAGSKYIHHSRPKKRNHWTTRLPHPLNRRATGWWRDWRGWCLAGGNSSNLVIWNGFQATTQKWHFEWGKIRESDQPCDCFLVPNFAYDLCWKVGLMHSSPQRS
jgi:hypothetical protein